MTDNPKLIEMEIDAAAREGGRKSRAFEKIGAFVFQFSQLEFTVRVLLGGMLKLTDEQFDAVTGMYDFRVLCTVTKTILMQKFQHKQSEIENVFKKCLTLNDERVRVAHGLWSDDGRGLSARHVTRGSLTVGRFFENPDDLARLTDTARQLMAEVLHLTRDDKASERP